MQHNSNNKTIIFFDIDDTLYDSSNFRVIARKESIRELNKSLKKFNHSFTEEYLYDMFEKIYQEDKNSSKMYDKLLERLNIPIYEISMHVAKTVKKWEDTKNKMKTFDNVKDVLDKLIQKGYKLGIASSGLSIKQWDKLLRIGLSDYFDPINVFITEEINGIRRKYSKDTLFYLQIKHYYKKEKFEHFYMIGDKFEQDIQPALDAGFNTILFQEKKYIQNYKEEIKKTKTQTITSFSQLLDIF